MKIGEKMYYVDSSVIIAAYFPNDPLHDVSLRFMDELDEGIISIFGLAEIGGFISRNSSPEYGMQFIDDLSQLPNLQVWF